MTPSEQEIGAYILRVTMQAMALLPEPHTTTQFIKVLRESINAVETMIDLSRQ